MLPPLQGFLRPKGLMFRSDEPCAMATMFTLDCPRALKKRPLMPA